MSKDWNINLPVEYFCESYYYLIDGKKYWRVTRVKGIINQPGLNQWRTSLGKIKSNQIMKIRQDYGTKFHKLAEIILNGDNINVANYSEEMQKDISEFTGFVKEYGIIAEATEQKLYHNELMIAGTADFIGYANLPLYDDNLVKVRVIGDWKTSTDIYDDYWLQIAAYTIMFEKLTGIKLDGAFIAQFRDGKLKLKTKTYDELSNYWEVFKHAIELFKYQKKVLKWQNV